MIILWYMIVLRIKWSVSGYFDNQSQICFIYLLCDKYSGIIHNRIWIGPKCIMVNPLVLMNDAMIHPNVMISHLLQLWLIIFHTMNTIIMHIYLYSLYHLQFLINNIISSLHSLFIVIIVSQNSIETIANLDSILEAHTYPKRIMSLLFNYFPSFSSVFSILLMESCSTLSFIFITLATLLSLHYVEQPLKYRSKLTGFTLNYNQTQNDTTIRDILLSHQVSQLHIQPCARKRVNLTIPSRPLDDDTIEKIFSRHLIPRKFISYSILISF